MGGQNEVTQKDQDQNIAQGSGFDKLESRHYGEQGEPGITPDNGPVLGKHAQASNQNQRHQYPAWNFPDQAKCLYDAPSQCKQGKAGDPQRYMEEMRQHGEHKAE